MSKTVKSYAMGNFEARVNVSGRDEVSQLAMAFNDMADSLENLEKLRNGFVANLSHDLRTPMTTIVGFIDGIIDGTIDSSKQSYYLGIVSDEVKRLSRLVQSM
jgi:signal transduction histidine kinase